jgi:ankyrin repeat protein
MSEGFLNEVLICAARHGHTETAALLLDRGADIHAGEDEAFRLAVINGHTETVKVLLDRGADLHADEDGALRSAVIHGHTETAALLLDRGANIHTNCDQALRRAALYGRTKIVERLLDRGADIHAEEDEAFRGSRTRPRKNSRAAANPWSVDHKNRAQNRRQEAGRAQLRATLKPAFFLKRQRYKDVKMSEGFLNEVLICAATHGHTETAALLPDRVDVHAEEDAALCGAAAIYFERRLLVEAA